MLQYFIPVEWAECDCCRSVTLKHRYSIVAETVVNSPSIRQNEPNYRWRLICSCRNQLWLMHSFVIDWNRIGVWWKCCCWPVIEWLDIWRHCYLNESQRRWQLWSDAVDESDDVPQRPDRVETSGDLQILVRDRRWVLPIRWADVRPQIWIVDLRRFSGTSSSSSSSFSFSSPPFFPLRLFVFCFTWLLFFIDWFLTGWLYTCKNLCLYAYIFLILIFFYSFGWLLSVWGWGTLAAKLVCNFVSYFPWVTSAWGLDSNFSRDFFSRCSVLVEILDAGRWGGVRKGSGNIDVTITWFQQFCCYCCCCCCCCYYCCCCSCCCCWAQRYFVCHRENLWESWIVKNECVLELGSEYFTTKSVL